MEKPIYLILLSLTVYACGLEIGFKEYIPTFNEQDERGFYTSRDSLTKLHKKNIQTVFKYYDIPFKVKGDKIYYKRTD